jgi:hypothetical protein
MDKHLMRKDYVAAGKGELISVEYPISWGVNSDLASFGGLDARPFLAPIKNSTSRLKDGLSMKE